MKKLITAALLTAALIPAASFASKQTTINDWFLLIKDDKVLMELHQERLHAAYDAYSWANIYGLQLFCPPGHIVLTRDQISSIYDRALLRNPRWGEEPVAVLNAYLLESMIQVFPLSKKDDGTRYCPE
jgi:hypothetical protein